LVTNEADWSLAPVAGDTVAVTGRLKNTSIFTQFNTTQLAKVAPPNDAVTESVFNVASNLQITEVITQDTTGKIDSDLHVTWDNTNGMSTGEWDVYIRDVDVSDGMWNGDWNILTTYGIYDMVIKDGKAYFSAINNNTTTPF